MDVALIGATGRTGRLVLQELLERGHSVSVLVRDPAKLQQSGLRVVTGSATDPAAVSELVQGADAVVSALGPTAKDPDLHRRAAEVLVEALPQGARFIGISGAGISVPGDRKRLPDRLISAIVRLAGGAMAADKAEEYRIFAGSALDWTLVRPPRLLDAPATGRVASDPHTPRHWSIPRADLARFMVEALEQHRYPRQAVFVWAK